MTNEQADKILEIAIFCKIDAHKFSFKKDPDSYLVVLGKEEDFEWDNISYYYPHIDWNLLIEAWHKFSTMYLYDFAYNERKNIIAKAIISGTISEAFEALYEGIYWYNSTRK